MKQPFAIEVLAFQKKKEFASAHLLSEVGRWWADSMRELLGRTDAQGISVRDAIRRFWIESSTRFPWLPWETIFWAIVEFHIEQGPVLETMKRPLGVVDAIAGQSRLEFIFVGRGQPCGYDADASAPRCNRGRGGVDHRSGAGSNKIPGWSPPWDQSRPNLAPLTSLRGRRG